ncbi:MAG: OmpA family protein, partial [Flavobacteriales bacterium]
PDSRMMVNPRYVAPGNYIVTPNLNVPQNPNYIQIPANSGQNIQYQTYPDQSNGYIRTYPNSSETRDYSSALVLDNFFVLFAKDSWELSYEAKKQLRDYIIALGLNADYKLLISGHTDTDGSPGYNIELGQKRASAVSAYLSEFGLKEGRIITISYGEHRPNSSNYTMESMARNRRVEVMLIR